MTLLSGLPPLRFRRYLGAPGTEGPWEEEAAMMGEWGLPVLLSRLSIDHVLLVLGCALSEMQVVLVSPEVQEVSACVVAVLALLRPLRWAGALLVALPRAYQTYLESPVPLLVGCLSLPPGHGPQPGALLVDLRKNSVALHPEDAKAFHSLMLPEASELCHELAMHAEAVASHATLKCDSSLKLGGRPVGERRAKLGKRRDRLRAALQAEREAVHRASAAIRQAAKGGDAAERMLRRAAGGLRARRAAAASAALDLAPGDPLLLRAASPALRVGVGVGGGVGVGVGLGLGLGLGVGVGARRGTRGA